MDKFEDYRLEVKYLISKNLAEGIEKILKDTSKQSLLLNDLINIIGRHIQLNKDFVDGLISYEVRNIELNRIRFKLIEFIDEMTTNDFQVNFEEFKIEMDDLKSISKEEDKIISAEGKAIGNILYTSVTAFA